MSRNTPIAAGAKAKTVSLTATVATAQALRSGFRSLRRFNAVFAEVYKRSPAEIRRVRRLSG
jgi:transcriptional regulator GlxA family with amidase domain